MWRRNKKKDKTSVGEEQGLGHTAKQTRLLLTIDIKTVLVQGVGTQFGDASGQLAQLPVQLFSVHSTACRVRPVGTNCVHTGGISVFLRPWRKRHRSRASEDPSAEGP